MSFDHAGAELARSLYEESPMPVRDIAALSGVCERSVYRQAARHGWRRRRTRLAIWQQSFREQAPAEIAMVKRPLHLAKTHAGEDRRRALVARLWSAAEKHMASVEARLAQSLDDPLQAQSDIQLFALLSRSLQQLALLDRALAPEADDDEFPRSDEELRRELLRKMDALIAGQPAGVSREPDAG